MREKGSAEDQRAPGAQRPCAPQRHPATLRAGHVTEERVEGQASGSHGGNPGESLPLGPQEACQAARAVVKLRRFYLPNQPNCNHLLGSVWVYLGDQLFGANSGDDPRHPRIEGQAAAAARRLPIDSQSLPDQTWEQGGRENEFC